MLESELVILPDTIDSNPPVDRLEMGDNERAIRIYSENRKKLIDTWKVEGHSNDVASRAVESGFQNSDSLLYDKAVSNPEAIGMTLDEVKYDRGRAVATVAKYAYLEKAEDIFSKVLLETGNPLKAQRSADVALDYFFNETARIKDPEEQKLRARKLMDDLQVYDEDGMSYGNFADMTLYMQKKSAEDKNIIIPGGDPTSIAVSKTFVNTDADLGFTHRLLLSAANSMIPTVGLEAGGLDWLQSQQRKYEAYKDAGNVNLAETAAGIAGVLIQARLLNKGIGKWSGLRTIGGVSAASYLATSVGLGAIQDIAESQRGIKQQYFSAIDRTDDKKFLKQYMESRGFDLATAVIGANTGSWIESGLFARGMRQLATTRNVGRLITAQWASPVLDTTVDLALDVIGHNSAVALFGQDEPVFTNAQNLQFSFQGKTQEQIVNQIATLYGTRMAARIGSGALNHALTKRNLDVSKELPENTMGTVEWFDKEIDAAGGNRLLAQGNKTLARLTYNMFGNNLGDLDAAFKENRRSVAPDFTTFLRQSGTNPAVSMRNLASLYMVREAQKNWVVSAVSGIIDGRITRNLSSIKPDMDDADVIINDLAQIRKNEVTNVQRQADIKAIGMAMSARLQGQAPEVIQRELDLLFETHKFSEEGTKLLTIFLKSGLVGEGAQGRQSVITEYIETAKKRQQERVSLSTEDKMNFIDGIQREARALLSGTDLPGTVFGITSGVSNVVLRSREAQQTLLEHTDNRLRMITERGDGLLDIIVGGKPQSLNALRTGAGAYLTARAAAGAITQDNAHDQIRGHLQDYITLAVREAGEAIRNVINSNPDPAVLNEQIRTFNTTLAWAAAAYPQIGEIRAQIDATRTVYEASSDATKKAFDSYLKKNAKLTSLINKEGEVEDGKMFTKLLGMMAAGVDEIRYDRFIFNSSVGKTSGITAVEDILKLINEGVTTDVMRRVARSNVGFNIPSAENLDDNPSLWIRDVDGNRHRVIVSGESMRKEIDAGLVYLMGTTSTEINEGMARNIAILLRAAYFKEMALGAPPRNSIHDVITDLETSGAIVRDAVTGDIDVTDINILTARLRQTQSLVRFAIEKASNNYTQANPELRTGKTVTVAASFLDKTATGNVEITYEEAINHLQRRASNIGHNLNAAAAVLASAYDRATAITRLETFINTIAINARGAAGVYIIPPAQLTRIVTRMVDDALDMRGRSTTFDVGEDRLIYTSEFSAGIESVYRDHGHTFVSIDGSKFDSGLSGEQAKLAGVITKDEFEDDEYMLNTHGLVKLQVGGVNAKAVYMKVPDLTGDSAQDKQVLANFWADICCSMQLRIRNRDHFDTMSAPGTPNPMATRYSNAMEAVFRTAEATPPRSRAELNEFTSRLLRNVATAGKNSIDAILTRMGVALDTESPRTKVTTSGGENRLDAVSAALAIETIRLHSFALGSQINTYRSNLSPANLALFDTEYTKMTTAIENAPDGTDLTTIKNDFITAISTLHAAPPPPPVAGAAALPAVVLDPTAMRTALDSVVDNTKRGAHNSYLNVVRHINTIFDNLRGIAGLPVGTALNLDSITNAIRTSQGLSAFMRSGSDLASGVENALYQINRVMQNARSVAENNLLLTQADNQDIIIEGRSLGISNGVEIGNSTIRNEFIEKLREMKESFESVLAPKPGSIDSPRYTTQTVNPKDTKDNLRALQLLGNMLLFGTKFVHAQADIQKRGAGTREVKHLGFSRLAELVDTGKTNMILFDIGLNYVDGLPVGAGLHYLSEDMFEIVDRNGGSKPTLTGDTSLVKCQFAKGNANMTFIKDLVNARNQVRHGRTTIVQVGTRRFRTADELIIVGRNLYYNMNNVEELDASGAVIGRATIPAVKMSFMTLDHDSIKQFSPNFIESTLNIGNGEDGCTHMRMRRAFQSATFSGSMNNSGANTVLDVDTDVLEIRNRQVHSDILRSFMTHRNTSTTYGKDNTISFQGANDDPLTKAYLSNTIRANAGKMLVDIDKTLAPRFLTAQGVKEQMQEMSNAVSNTETSPGVTVVIKNKRFATDVLDVPNSRILVPSKDGSIASTTGSTWPCRADVSDGMIANIAVKIMKDTADNSYYMIDNTGAKVTVSANDLLSDITTLRRTNPAGKQAAAERLMRFCSASANSPIRLMTQGANQAFFINLTRSPNIQKGQGQSLPALITGIINNDDQLAISSALTKINLADFDGDTMSTQDLNIEDIRVMLENTIGGVNKVTDSEILQYLQEQAALSISKNIFTTSLAPTQSKLKVETLRDADKASGVVIGAFNSFNRLITRMNLAANDMTFESDPASEAFGLNKDVDAGVIYADNKNSTYSAKDFKGSVDGYQYIDKRIIGGTEYDVIRIASRMPDGQLEYKLLLCSNTAGGSTELTGLGYSIKYVVSIDDTSSSYNRALQDLSLAASNSKDSLEKFMPKRIINVISQDLRFSSVALVHKILQSMSIDAQKYKTLYSVFETYRENFPDKIESLAKYMLASRFTRAMFSQVHGTVFASSKHTTSVAPLTPTTAVTPTEVEAQEYLKRRTIVTKALKGDYNDIDSILNQLTAHGISDAEYNLIYRFGSKKVITSASDISDIIRLMDSNQFIKTLAEQYLTGQKMEDLDPDFLKGLLAAGLISRAKSKMANSASEAAREMNIEHDDFFADKDVPRAFKSADGKESGMPLKLVSAIELRDSLNEINQAFSEETMVDYTPVTMRKLQQELKTEVTFDIGTMGTSRAQFITRLYNRMMTNNPGLHLTENDVRHAFDRLGITLEEGRVLTLDAKNNTGLLQRRMTTGASGTLDTSKDAKRLMQRGQYGDDDISAEGVILKKGDKVVTVHDMFTLFDTEISRLTKSVETHKSSKPSSKRTTPNDVRDREMFKALIVEMAGELPRTQQAALKASFNGITFDIMGAVVAGNGKINGVMAEMFFRNRQNSSSKFLFKSIFSSPEEMGVC